MALDRGLTILLELGGPVDLLTTGLNHRDVVVKARRLAVTVAVRVLSRQAGAKG
jgi:hypothetical protein